MSSCIGSNNISCKILLMITEVIVICRSFQHLWHQRMEIVKRRANRKRDKMESDREVIDGPQKVLSKWLIIRPAWWEWRTQLTALVSPSGIDMIPGICLITVSLASAQSLVAKCWMFIGDTFVDHNDNRHVVFRKWHGAVLRVFDFNKGSM